MRRRTACRSRCGRTFSTASAGRKARRRRQADGSFALPRPRSTSSPHWRKRIYRRAKSRQPVSFWLGTPALSSGSGANHTRDIIAWHGQLAVRADFASAITNDAEEERKIMSKIKQEVLSANAAYAADFGDKANLPMPPGRGFAILTCMDARLDPAKYAGLAEGDAHVIRNAGGRASDDAIRSLVISHKLLGTNEWFVIHHTDCGMETFTNEIMSDLLASSLDTATIDENGWRDIGAGPGSEEGRYINWLTISNQAESVRADVARIKSHPLVPDGIPVHGYIYDCKTGKLVDVSG